MEDTLRPDRLVFGTHSAEALAMLEEIYALPISDRVPVVRCDIATAELIKVAANSFLATKISFINAMAQMCQAAAATSPCWRTRSATTGGSAGSSSTPDWASAAAACPRTSRRWP